MFGYKDVFGDKKKVLVITAHPDDADVFFGGTISLLRKDKKDVFVLVMTNGARGSRDNHVSEEELAIARIEEQRKALRVYGVPSNHFNTLNYKDGEAENNMELIGKIAFVIRKFAPDIVLTHNPNYYFAKSFSGEHYHANHRDHRMCGISAMDAVYPFSRDRNFFIEHEKEGVGPHSVRAMLFTAVPAQINAQIDISSVVEKKRSGLRKHQSQFDDETVKRIIAGGVSGKKNIESGFYINLR